MSLANRLLQNGGELVRFKVGGDSLQFDPITGEPIAGDAPLFLELLAYPSRYNNNEINGQQVQSGDVRLIVEPSETRPDAGWSVLVNGVEYRVMNVQTIRKNGVDELNICQLRAN